MDGNYIDSSHSSCEANKALHRVGFYGHTDSVFCIEVSADGSKIVSGGADEIAFLWTLESLFDEENVEPEKALKGHGDSVVACCFNFDNTMVATASMDSTIRLYDAEDGQNRGVLEGPGDEIIWMRPHKTKNILLCGSKDFSCWVFDFGRGSDGFISAFARHLSPVTCGDFLTNHFFRKAVTCSDNGEIYIWDTETARTVLKIPSLNSPINCIAVSNNTFTVGTFDKGAHLISIKSGESLFVTENRCIESVGYCNSGALIFSGGLDGCLFVWDVSTTRLRFKRKFEAWIITVTPLKTRPLLACALDNGHLALVDYRSGEVFGWFEGHSERILAISCPHDESFIATAGDDGVCFLHPLD